MAKAQFQVGQRVFVRPVGAWARVEKLNPVWTTGVDEPLRITYDVGMGREFTAADLELAAEEPRARGPLGSGVWRVMRGKNRIRENQQASLHPDPGSYPVVQTGAADWGGWRVPAAEYDLDPDRIERQAKLIAAAPRLRRVAEKLAEFAERRSKMPDELKIIAQEAAIALGAIDGFEATYEKRATKDANGDAA